MPPFRIASSSQPEHTQGPVDPGRRSEVGGVAAGVDQDDGLRAVNAGTLDQALERLESGKRPGFSAGPRQLG